MLEKSGYMLVNDINVVVDEVDYAETEHTITASSLNLYGYVHGGLYFSLADASAGVASRSNGDSYVTLSSSFNYMKAAQQGTLRACARVVSRTSRICVVDVQVRDKESSVLSSGTFTMYRVSTR